MCDYSLHNVVVRPARVGEKLVTAQFIDNRSFGAVDDPNIAVCMAAGTELAFDRHIECEPTDVGASLKKIRHKRARFWQIGARNSEADRDALEFKDGLIVPLKNLRLGQYATVVELPVMSQPKSSEAEAEMWGGLPRRLASGERAED
jgi:hypothetical protein